MWAAALYAGLRRGELRALRVSNLRGLDGNEVAAISVEHGWDDKEGERATNLDGRRPRDSDAGDMCAIIAAHIERLELTGEDLVFAQPKSRGKPFIHHRICPRPGGRGVGLRSFLDAAGSPKRARRYLERASTSVGRRDATR